jgi:serine/threonine protein kinase
VIPKELRIPGYDIEVLLGKGGMAAVYKARQQSFGREVALKVLNPAAEDLAEFSRRFLQESSIVAKLHHSHIVQVYDVGQYDNYFYISMEYLHGGDLSGKLNEGLSLKDTVKIITQLADALDFAHRKNIIHRDIKPANVMFREDGAAVLTDFGIAKELESQAELTQAGVVIGTPRYMSPEQIRGDKVDHRADIYSLGIVFYRCLTNYVPFDGKDMLTTAYLQDNEPVPLLPPEVACFQPIINRMLEKSPDARFQRGRDVVDALDELDKSAYPADLTNLAVAAANKLSPPTVTAVSGRHTLGMSSPVLPDSSMEGTQVRSSLSQTVRAEHMKVLDPLAASARYPAVGAKRKRRSPARTILLLFMFSSVLVFASAHYTGELEPLYRATWVNQLRGHAENLWARLISIDTVPALPDEVFDVSFTDGEPNSIVAVEDEPDVVANADEASQPQPVVTATDIAIEAGVSGEPAPHAVEGAEPNAHQVSAADDTSSTEAEVPLTEGAVAVSDDPVQELPTEVEVPAEPDTTEIVAGLLVEAETHMDNWRLRKPAEDNAYLKYQQVLELEPENHQARDGMSRIAAIYAKMAERAIKEKEFGKARGFIDESRAVAADNAGLQKLEDKLMLAIAEQQELEALAAAAKKAEKIDNLLALARADEEAGRIRSPVGNNALEKYQQILDLDPDNDLAIDKLIEYGR